MSALAVRTRARLVAGAIVTLSLSAGACLVACSGPGNTGRVMIGDELVADVPWLKGRAPLVDEMGEAVLPFEPVYPPIATGMEDPGSDEVDCSQLDGLEFSTEIWFDDFEAPNVLGGVGAAEFWSSYDDSSDGVFRVPGMLSWYAGLDGRADALWGMPAEQVSGAPTCNGGANDWVFHFRGGRFNRYGGGIAHPLGQRCGDEATEHEYCRPNPGQDEEFDAAGFPLTAPDGSPYDPPLAHEYVDVSGFDGVSFWARRGPESQGSIAIVVFDKHTSDALNRENATYCRRLRSCQSGCLNRLGCNPTDAEDPTSLHRCFDPEVGIPVNVTTRPDLIDELYPRCGPSACTFRTEYADPEFEGKECRPYTFQTHETGEYCFDEGDPPPPEADERCGDGYGYQLTFTTNWEFYKVPFSEMRQLGHGKVAPDFDLTTISDVAVVTAKGWVDIYLDDMSFYREAQ